MNIYERIKLKADETGISIKALEKEVGLGNGVIRHWKDNSPQCNKLEKVANYLQVSIEWIITGKEANNLSREENEIISAYKKANETDRQIVRLTLEKYMKNNQKSSDSAIG